MILREYIITRAPSPNSFQLWNIPSEIGDVVEMVSFDTPSPMRHVVTCRSRVTLKVLVLVLSYLESDLCTASTTCNEN